VPGTGCYVKGAPRLLTRSRAAGIKDGETTLDLEYTLETWPAIGSCALAPVMVVNGRVHGSVTPEKVKAIVGYSDRSMSRKT